ncbi:DUF4351 domain-containing protein, partial [Brasilonema sp. UFV-L1]|uniref:DUF4351 domain-containing protein n=1 Tax=Brasilonema sp. UFV-L1 TaxID=2234130 RepID=UPI00145E8FF3
IHVARGVSIVTLQLDPARMQLISGFVDTYLNLTESEEQVFQAELGRISPEEREQVMQIVTSWMRTGIEQGKREGEVSIVMRLLKRKVGELEPEVEAQVRGLEVAQLEELSEALLDFSEMEDLRIWLRNLEG